MIGITNVRYITHTASLDFYDQQVVEKVINYFENFVKPILSQIYNNEKEKYPALVSVIDKTIRSRRVEAPVSYDPHYDKYMNYVRFILENLNMIEDMKKELEMNEDLFICIIAAHIRKKLR